MTENKYLEKIALRREKAEAMARAARVITDPSSNWKYALRQFRDSRGDVVTGAEWKRVADKLAGGVDVRREHQQLSAVQRSLRDVDEAQEAFHEGRSITGKVGLIGTGHISPASAANDVIKHDTSVQTFSDAVRGHYSPGKAGLSLAHVHPYSVSKGSPVIQEQSRNLNLAASKLEGTDKIYAGNDLENRFLSTYPSRLAAPSGSPAQREAFRHMSPVDRRRISLHVGNLQTRMTADAEQGNITSFMDASNRLAEYRRAQKMMQAKASIPTLNGDEYQFDLAYPGSVNRIHAPSVHTVGLFKSTKGPEGFTQGKRSVYLDLTPRAKRE